MLFIKNDEIVYEPRPEKTDWRINLLERIEGFYEPTVYIIKECSTGRFYIGSRTGKNCKDDDIGKLYFTHSKQIKEAWKKDTSLFEILNVYKCESNRSALWYESFLIENFNAVKDKSFINKSNGGETFSIAGTTLSNKVKEKLSLCFKGRKLSETHKNKLSLANQGKVRSKESKEKQSKTVSGENNHFYGKTHSQESKDKMSECKIGKTLSEACKEKMKLAKLGNKNHMYGNTHSEEARNKISERWKSLPILTCPHCGKESNNVGNMNRYHFDNCKIFKNL